LQSRKIFESEKKKGKENTITKILP